ncbi:hypothetical protein HIM_02615 [Hirsutella minnesotensis 3608]|nr:hypothetical protein HIM_02615 [Hirsutella minnesotensis 3608]
MRFPLAAICLSAVLAPAIAANEAHKVPGESPLYYCPGDVNKDYLEIDSVNLIPNPPQIGGSLLINAAGTVKKTIEKGAKVDLFVKLGFIQIVHQQIDLCDQVAEVDLKCPIKPGKLIITKTVTIPPVAPPGRYLVQADVTSRDDEPITCMNATVELTRPAFFNIEL